MADLQQVAVERASLVEGCCESDGLHHKDCPGVGNVLHHVIRRQDAIPNKVDRDSVEYTRWVWNGPTTLGASGCHGLIHSNQDKARELGLLIPRPAHALTLTALGWYTSSGALIK